uniref:RIMS-binding protein 2 n=1 Tax=Gopherus agassizii TaxID=38772 RepID=A0A452I2W3_9SAUR
MTRDSPGGGPPPGGRLSPRKAAAPPAGSQAQHDEHKRELEALRAELDGERLRSQESRRRFAAEARELREAAERERQLLADQLRSKWEQQRARELHQLRELSLREREAEIRQLIRWKDAELRQAQELLQRERDAAVRQARDLQRQLAEELVSRGYSSTRGCPAGLSSEGRGKLQEVLGKLRWETDGDQAARIRHLRAELELERSLFLKYILERFEGEQQPAGSPHRARHGPLPRLSRSLLEGPRPRSLESLIAAASPDGGAARSRSLDSSLAKPESSQPGHQAPLEGSPPQSPCPGQQPAQKALEEDQEWLSGSSYSQLVKQNTDLLSALEDLEQRCTALKEENGLLRRNSFPEMQEKVKRLKRKNADLAIIAKRLEERARKLQESNLKVVNAPMPVSLKGSSVELCKKAFARQRAKDLSEQASILLAKDKQIEALQRECWELHAKLATGKEGSCWLNLSDFDRLLRESQKEVLRLQRQITLKNLKESLQSSKMGPDSSSPAATMCLIQETLHLEVELSKKFKQCENLEQEMEKKQKKCEELEMQLQELLTENARMAEENTQLKEWNSAVQLTKGLQTKVEDLEHVLKDMKEMAERRQQLEVDHEETLLVLQKKEEEVKYLQQAQVEAKREHEEVVQLLEAQVRELENQYHNLPHATCCSSEDCHALQCSKTINDVDFVSTPAAFKKQSKKPEFQSNSSKSESTQYSPKSCPTPEGDSGSEMDELETDKFSLILEPERQGPAKLQVFLARYSYDPFDGPNKNPEAELPLTAGEYIYIYGEMDEDGFFEGELMDGRRGLVPSNLIEEVSDDDLMTFVPPKTSDLSHTSDHEMSFLSRSASSGEKKLCQNVRSGCQTQAAIENLDLKIKAYRISVQSVTEKGNSDKMQCTFLVGQGFHLAPALLKLRSITATSAEVTWLPSSSNYTHAVYLNEKECDVTKAGIYWYTFHNLQPNTQYNAKVETQPQKMVWDLPQEKWEQKSAMIKFITPSAGPPDAPLDVQVQPDPSAGILVISWLPVTIDAAGSSNGVRVTGYAVYVNGQRVTEVISPTAGSAIVELSQLEMLQESQKVSVRTVSSNGESVDSVPALIPSAMLNVPSCCSSSKSTFTSLTSELPYGEFIDSQHVKIPLMHCTSSPSSEMFMASQDNKFTIHFTSNCGDSVASLPASIPRNQLFSSQSSSLIHELAMCNIGDNIARDKDDKCLNSGPQLCSSQLELEDSYRDIGIPNICVQKAPYISTEKKQTKELCKEVPSLGMSRGEIQEDQTSRIGHWQLNPVGDHSHSSDLSDILEEEEEDLDLDMQEENRIKVVGNNSRLLELPEFPMQWAQNRKMSKTLRIGQAGTSLFSKAGPLRSFIAEEIDDDDAVRIFVALFDYDPMSMSPNLDAAEEELPFKKGQILKVVGDKDADGFYRGEYAGRAGYIPYNMVSEVQVESSEMKQHLLKQGSITDEKSAINLVEVDTKNNKSHPEHSWQDSKAEQLTSKTVVAAFDYNPRENSLHVDVESELTFNAGDIITVFGSVDDDGFYYGELNGQRGLIPSDFVKAISRDEE